MTEKKLDEILYIVKGIEAKILDMLKPESQEKVIKELTNTVQETITTDTDYRLPKTGKYQWYMLKTDSNVKLRKCLNEGCLLFLKWNDDKKKYEHWKYDANSGEGGFVADKCDFYGG